VFWYADGVRRSSWAAACFPPGRLVLPEVDDVVWIAFEDGDLNHPVWIGCAWTHGMEIVSPDHPD